MRVTPGLAAAALLLAGSSSAWAWNDRGHMMVAAVAWDQLDDAKRTRAVELLRRNPNYQDWIAGVPAERQDKTAFVTAATWPDFLRGIAKKPKDAKPGDYVDDGSNPAKAKGANLNVGYRDKNLHRYWHFVDLPLSTEGVPGKPPQKPNALTRIVLHRDTLAAKVPKTKANESRKSYDLVWLLHLVGDVHQPLHATARFSKATPDGDFGGNSVTVCLPTPFLACGNPLHSYWDETPGEELDAASAIEAAGKLAKAPDAAAAIADPRTWIDESFALAQAKVYVPPIGPGLGPFNLDPGYETTAKEIAAERIAVAGARLARLLNAHLR